MDQLSWGTQIPRERRDPYQDLGSPTEKGGNGGREAEEKPFPALQMGHCPLEGNLLYFIS